RTLMKWCTGQLVPRSLQSFEALAAIEQRYRLPAGYFKSKIARGARPTWGNTLASLPPSERRRVAWHLPDDFLRRPKAEQEEILAWVRRVIISGSTDYRRYQAEAIVRRQIIWRSLGLGLAEYRPRLWVDVMRRACGAASADAGWFVV